MLPASPDVLGALYWYPIRKEETSLILESHFRHISCRGTRKSTSPVRESISCVINAQGSSIESCGNSLRKTTAKPLVFFLHTVEQWRWPGNEKVRGDDPQKNYSGVRISQKRKPRRDPNPNLRARSGVSVSFFPKWPLQKQSFWIFPFKNDTYN